MNPVCNPLNSALAAGNAVLADAVGAERNPAAQVA